MTVEDDAIELLKAETVVLYDQVETIEAAIRWCIRNRAMVVFPYPNQVNVTIWRENKIMTGMGGTFLDTIDDFRKRLAEEGEAPYVNSD